MAGSSRLILVRHGRPAVRRDRPSTTWELEGDARPEVLRLARALPQTPTVTSSDEPKAVQTAELIRDVVGGDLRVDARLREVTRPDRWLLDYDELAARYLSGEQQPDWEPADRVLARVTAAMNELRVPTIVVGHGLSLTLYTASRATFDHVAFWRFLRLPDAWMVTDGGAPRRISAR